MHFQGSSKNVFSENCLLSGHAMSRQRLIDGLNTIGENQGGDFFQNFLTECECFTDELEYLLITELKKNGKTTTKKSCLTIEKYESSVVTYKGIVLTDLITDDTVSNLSKNMDVQITLLLERVEEMFPEVILDKKDPERRKQSEGAKMFSLKIFDHR